MSSAHRARFAPSPTGALHLGHARTFLVAWLRARSLDGSIVMRIEDLDEQRAVPGAADAMLRDLEWLGLEWDEGPPHGGPDAPYEQSARSALYERALGELAARGLVYPCTCSRKEVASIASAPHGAEELGVRYPGTCRDGPTHPERPAALRFRMPEPAPSFVDGLHGPVDAREWGGDFVVRRADGAFAYQLAVVVDDAAMRITEVVRGDDLLASTPRQLALFAGLGLTAPAYVHVPLVRGPGGERLAKRHGAISIAEHRERGVAAETIVGALAASLGLVPEGTRASARELVASFSLDRVSETRPIAL